MDPDLSDALSELFQDLEAREFRDRLGHPLTNLVSYTAVKAMVELLEPKEP